MLALRRTGIRSACRMMLAMTAVVVLSGNCHAMQDSVLEELGRMIGGAFGGAPDEQPLIQEVQVFQADGGNEAAVPEKDRTEFKDRVTSFSNAMFRWVIRTCEVPEAEQAKIREAFEAQIRSHVETFEKRGARDQRQQQSPFPKTMLLLFTQDDAAGSDFRDAVLQKLRKDLLTEEQKQKLETALTERESFRTRAISEFLTTIVDRELFLTSEQRTQMVDKLVSMKKPPRHTFYSFQAQSYYMPYESLSPLLSRAAIKDLLSPAQRKRLTDLSGSDPNDQLVFQAAEGREVWVKAMADMASSQRSKYLRSMAVRVAWLEQELKLSAEQVEYLNIASKGAAIRALGDWKEQTLQTLDQMEQQMAQMGGNFGFGASPIDNSSIDQNEIWTASLKEVAEGKAADLLKDRNQKLGQSVAACLVAMFDDEMWLTPEQRTNFQPIVAKSLPKANNQMQYYDYIRELIWMAYPLHKSDDKAREAVLTEEQNAVWKLLKSTYSFQKENNYVQIQLRNQGGSFGFMLND